MSVNRGMDKDVAHIHNGMLLSHKREWNNDICSYMDGPLGPLDYHTKWGKSDRQGQIPYNTPHKGTLLHCWWECKLVQPLWRTVWGFLKKLEIELPYDPAIPLLGIHTEETRSERDTCTPMFIATLFIIARTWKQPRYRSADKWIRKLWYIYTMEYYSAIKKNIFESVLTRWMKLEPIIQSEVSQKENTNMVY